MLMIRGKQHSDVLRTLERALEQANDWSTQNKLSISKEKSAVMPMFIKKRDEYESHPTIIAWKLKVVSKMKYLGVMLDSKLDWFPHSIYLENKLLGIRNNLVRCSKATWGISFHNLKSIYNHAILPAITYAAEVWFTKISARANKKLQQIQRSFLIFLTKSYRTVSIIGLQTIAGVMSINLTLLMHQDVRAISSGHETNAVSIELLDIETPGRI